MLQKLLQASVQSALNVVGTGTAIVAQQGNSLTALHARKGNMTSRIVDLGASDHMTGDKVVFDDYNPCDNNSIVRIADGSYSIVAGI